MTESVPAEIAAQLARARAIIKHHLAPMGLAAVHLYGSALDGGLQALSDIDLMVTVAAPLPQGVRQALVRDLLAASAPPGQHPALRALEVTVLVQGEVVPWRYPARRELQFGEWLREEIQAGRFEPAVVDPDLAILLTKLRQGSVALLGPPAAQLFDPVPAGDLRRALSDTLTLWNGPADWAGEERDVVLTLARIWFSAATGRMAPKSVAADWAMDRLPAAHRALLFEARQAYLGQAEDHLAARGEQVAAWVDFVKRAVRPLLAPRG